MNHVLIAAALSLALAAAPSPPPLPLGTLQPFASAPPAAALPNIGRVRALVPACATMRDVVAPAFLAARRADARFAQTRQRLPDYAELVVDPLHRADVYRESALAKIDADATSMLGEALVISRALGDPRLAASFKDAQVQTERAELERVYEGQRARADLLEQFVIRQRLAISKKGIDDDSAFARRKSGATPGGAPEQPDPAGTPAPTMPDLNANPLSNKRVIGAWASEISSGVRQTENQAAKAFLTIIQDCRAS